MAGSLWQGRRSGAANPASPRRSVFLRRQAGRTKVRERMEAANENDPGKAPRRRPRWGTLALVVVGHVLVGTLLIRAFAPNLPTQAIEAVGSLVTVTITAPPEPNPEPDAGAAAEEGRKATPRPQSAPDVKFPCSPSRCRAFPRPARPPIPVRATRARAPARAAKESAPAAAPAHRRGRRNCRQGGSHLGRDQQCPRLSDPKAGARPASAKSVIIALTVGTDGKPSACRVYRSSGLPETGPGHLPAGARAAAFPPGDERARRANGVDLLLAAAVLLLEPHRPCQAAGEAGNSAA